MIYSKNREHDNQTKRIKNLKRAYSDYQLISEAPNSAQDALGKQSPSDAEISSWIKSESKKQYLAQDDDGDVYLMKNRAYVLASEILKDFSDHQYKTLNYPPPKLFQTSDEFKDRVKEIKKRESQDQLELGLEQSNGVSFV